MGMEAQFQADINWLHEEIDKIKDPRFLEKVKSLFEHRQKRQPMNFEELETKLQRSEEDIKAGRVHSTESLREHFKNRRA